MPMFFITLNSWPWACSVTVLRYIIFHSTSFVSQAFVWQYIISNYLSWFMFFILTQIYISRRDLRCLGNLLVLKISTLEPHHFCTMKKEMKEKKAFSKIFVLIPLKSQLSRNENIRQIQECTSRFSCLDLLGRKPINWTFLKQSGRMLLGKKGIYAFM